MAMQSRRLIPLQQVAENREEEALKRLVSRQRALAESEARLEELRKYVADYQAARFVCMPVMMVNRQAFIARLREAVRLQGQAVEQARVECEAERGRWIGKHRDVAVLDQLASCYRAKENLAAEQRAQKSMDEFALRQFCVGEPKGEIF